MVGEALGLLTPRQRAAIVLTELMGLSSEETGEILGIRPVTARVSLRRRGRRCGNGWETRMAELHDLRERESAR